MKPQEVRDMSDDELRAREHELADEVFHLRLKRATSQLPNPMKVRQTRRDLARVKTVLRQRSQGGGGPVAAPTRPAAPAERTERPAKKVATPRAKRASRPPKTTRAKRSTR
jgi:large subunit ribosomal protein L29